jgi:hypothetical protein
MQTGYLANRGAVKHAGNENRFRNFKQGFKDVIIDPK